MSSIVLVRWVSSSSLIDGTWISATHILQAGKGKKEPVVEKEAKEKIAPLENKLSYFRSNSCRFGYRSI